MRKFFRLILALVVLVFLAPIMPVLGIGAFGNILSGFMGGGSKVASKGNTGLPSYKRYFQTEDGDAAYDTDAELVTIVKALTTGVFSIFWQKTVPAQQQMRWGFGSAALPDNQGYWWFAIIDATTEFMGGVVRLCQSDANGYRKLVVQEVSDSQLHSTTNTSVATATLIDKAQMMPLPEKIEYPKVGEDSKLQIEYKFLTGTKANTDVLGFRVPGTIYPI
jgi:hypothetical protein